MCIRIVIFRKKRTLLDLQVVFFFDKWNMKDREYYGTVILDGNECNTRKLLLAFYMDQVLQAAGAAQV